ncbi:MAG: hypothetical protein IKF36_03315 [Bacilli bacterium]|nr:hypothetical protein [Bacilli bacterium]
MKNKNELVKKDTIDMENKNKAGKILLGVGIGIFLLGVLLIIMTVVHYNVLHSIGFTFKHIFGFILGGLLIIMGIGLGVMGIVFIIDSNKNITKKAKETLNKAEPVVTDVIKAVGEGIENIAHDVKESIDKNKNNKKGE